MKPTMTPRRFANLKLHVGSILQSSGASILVGILPTRGHRQPRLIATLWFTMRLPIQSLLYFHGLSATAARVVVSVTSENSSLFAKAGRFTVLLPIPIHCFFSKEFLRRLPESSPFLPATIPPSSPREARFTILLPTTVLRYVSMR